MPSISKKDLQRVKSDYLERIGKYGFHVDTLNSGGAEKQHTRHTVHSGLFDLQSKHVLDVGCGIGMFYQHLKSRQIALESYTGIEIVEPFIEHNRQTFPEARFERLDILEDPLTGWETDVVFMSQLFNNRYRESDNEEVARLAISRLFEIARGGLVIDFMTSYVDYTENHLHYFNPQEMFAFAKTLTPLVALRHDYLPFEFTLVLRRQARTA